MINLSQQVTDFSKALVNHLLLLQCQFPISLNIPRAINSKNGQSTHVDLSNLLLGYKLKFKPIQSLPKRIKKDMFTIFQYIHFLVLLLDVFENSNSIFCFTFSHKLKNHELF